MGSHRAAGGLEVVTRYTVTVAETEFAIEVCDDGIVLDGERLSARLNTVSGSVKALTMGDRTVTVTVNRAGEDWEIGLHGLHKLVAAEDERTRLVKKLAVGASAFSRGGLVKAPMPGLVLRVKAVAGQVVRQGDGLVVLEAMKMENEITAPTRGKVAEIMVVAGQTVEKGAPLFAVDPEP